MLKNHLEHQQRRPYEKWIYLQTNKHKTTNAESYKNSIFFLEHSIGKNKDNLIQQYCIYVPAQGRCSREQQKTTYQQHIAKAIYGNASVKEKVMWDAAGDRVAWRIVIKVASHFSVNGWDGSYQDREVAVQSSFHFTFGTIFLQTRGIFRIISLTL